MKKFTLLIYNPGIDRVPSGKLNTTLTQESFNEFKNRFQSESRRYGPCDDVSFVNSYNKIVTQNIKRIISTNNIDVCILQEICAKNLNDYNFTKYIAATYEFDKNTIKRRLLLVGTCNDTVSKIEIPNYIYDATFANTGMIDTPNDFIQVVKIIVYEMPFHIINIHRRAASIVKNEILFKTHMIGVISKIIKHNNNANIIICGDYNNRGFDINVNPNEDESTLNKFVASINNFIDPTSPTYERQVMTNKNLQWHDQVDVVDKTLTMLLANLGFVNCYNSELNNSACNIKEVVINADKLCNRELYNINDIIYYRLCANHVFSLKKISTDICNLHIGTSAHIPYIVTLEFDNTKQLNCDVPAFLNNLFNISDGLVKKTYSDRVPLKSMSFEPAQSRPTQQPRKRSRKSTVQIQSRIS